MSLTMGVPEQKPPPADLALLGPGEEQEAASWVKEVWERQVNAWLNGQGKSVEALLEDRPAWQEDRRCVALVTNEIALRQAVGEHPRWEEYRNRFPQFEQSLRWWLPRLEEPFSQRTSVRPADTNEATAGSVGSGLVAATLLVRDMTAPLGIEELGASQKAEKTLAQNAEPLRQVHVPGYEILGELGRGAVGVVYKARQLALNRVVALKMILAGAHASGEEMARFRIEAEAVAQIKHPNIVQVYDIGEFEGKAFFSLEYVEGGSLERRLNRKVQQSGAAAALVETLARAMQSAHDKGIIHRDLKPANILLSPDGVPKIADFGLAKRLEQDSHQTQSGSVMGTPSYMAPEQAMGAVNEIGPATDVYALGAILYDTLTGRPPFKGVTLLDTLAQVRNDEPAPPSRLQPRVPRDLETICLKCLEKSPCKRYASALELAEDLRRYQSGEPIQARPMGRAERLWRWCRRNPVAASMILAVTLGSAFGMWYLSRLSENLVRMTALEGAAQQTETFDQLNDYYSARIADPAKRTGVTVTHAYTSTPKSIPAPATLTIDLGDYITANSVRGTRVRLYSDLPFRSRKDGGVRDEFEREALERLRINPNEPVYRFEGGERPVLRYATARVMKEACVECHNSHPDSPRQDWEVGDVRGVLEIIRPLDLDQERTRQGLRGTFALVAGVSTTLMLVSTLTLLLSNRRRRAGRTAPLHLEAPP
jgi:hypothetical protein